MNDDQQINVHPLNLENNQPKDVITSHDVPPDAPMTLLDEVFAFEKKQEAAVNKAGEVLSTEFGGKADCLQYKIQPDGTLMVVYQIKKA